MDCANSGSLQSSSGGDEEYNDSRAAVSILMNTHSPPHLRPISTASEALLFYSFPIPNYTQLQNPNTYRPATMRSDPNPSSRIMEPQATVSRKRPRASCRRDPTTVLTTDTTNFRAMVQHFTGIPAAPPFNKTSSRSTGFFDPPYLRRQKVEPPSPFLVSSSTFTTPINYQLPLIQNPNSSSNSNFPCLLQSNPKFVFSSSNAIASKPYHQDSFGIPTNIDDFDFIDQNHA